jgi:ATP:ADP antiporter, AAA family
MRVDERQHHLPRRSSSAWAKYADALRRISLARRSSAFSRSNSFSRACSLAAASQAVVGSALAAYLVHRVDYTTLILISAVGFFWTAVLVTKLVAEKRRMVATGVEGQRTTLDRELSGNMFDGFKFLAKSRLLMLLALFLLLMTWSSTIVYVQLGDLITNEYLSREARIEAYAYIDLVVNIAAAAVQLFGTGRVVGRLGVNGGLLVNPILTVIVLLVFAHPRGRLR